MSKKAEKTEVGSSEAKTPEDQKAEASAESFAKPVLPKVDRVLADAIKAAIEAEFGRNPNRTTNLDPDQLRTTARAPIADRFLSAMGRLTQLDDALVAHPAPQLEPTLVAYATTIDDMIEELDGLVLNHPDVPRANRRYSEPAHARANALFEGISENRGRLDERLGPDGLDGQIRDAMSVGATFGPDAVSLVRDAGVRQVMCLERKEVRDRLKEQEIDPNALLATVKPLTDALLVELNTPKPLTRGASTEAIEKLVNLIDLGLKRGIGWLKDHGNKEIAVGLEGIVPRKAANPGRRAGDKKKKEDEAAAAKKKAEEEAAAKKKAEEEAAKKKAEEEAAAKKKEAEGKKPENETEQGRSP